MSWWSSYKGQSVGRVLHFLYHYCGLHVAESSTVRGNTVIYKSFPIATLTWVVDIPKFEFYGEGLPYKDRQVTHLREAIDDLDVTKYRVIKLDRSQEPFMVETVYDNIFEASGCFESYILDIPEIEQFAGNELLRDILTIGTVSRTKYVDDNPNGPVQTKYILQVI